LVATCHFFHHHRGSFPAGQVGADLDQAKQDDDGEGEGHLADISAPDDDSEGQYLGQSETQQN